MLDCALSIDCMAIRYFFYKTTDEHYVGFADYGNIIPKKSENIAFEALVVMLVGFKHSWKYLTGFFLTGKCDADMRIPLIKSCLFISAEHKLCMWSVTCDGT